MRLMGGDLWPFLGRQAVRRGDISAYQLRTQYQAVYRNVYVPKNVTLTALARARAAWLWSGGNATLTGLSAAAVLGTKWIDADSPAELSRVDRHCLPGIVTHSYQLEAREVCLVSGIRITTPERTAFDIGRTLPRFPSWTRWRTRPTSRSLTSSRLPTANPALAEFGGCERRCRSSTVALNPPKKAGCG
jgi:hypothetical protein